MGLGNPVITTNVCVHTTDSLRELSLDLHRHGTEDMRLNIVQGAAFREGLPTISASLSKGYCNALIADLPSARFSSGMPGARDCIRGRSSPPESPSHGFGRGRVKQMRWQNDGRGRTPRGSRSP